VYLASRSFQIPMENFDGSIGVWVALRRISASYARYKGHISALFSLFKMKA
jgi:hypothetical protein